MRDESATVASTLEISSEAEIVMDTCLELTARKMVFCVSDQGQNQFSGVLIRDDDRYFVATAAHCLQNVRDGKSLTISTWTPRARSDARTLPGCDALMLEANQVPDADTDIALLRLPDEFARDCDGEFLTREGLSPGTPKVGLPVLFFGFPSAWQSPRDGRVTPEPLPLFANVIEPPEPSFLATPIEPDVDFFVKYGPKVLREGVTPRESPRLQGVSGGGVFGRPVPTKSKVWSASDIRLAGILSSALYPEFARAKSASYLELLLDEAKLRS
jgi:hypothetical protein